MNPYYRVKVTARVRLHPRDMNNNIVENIKNEALREYVNRCYMDYGYVDGIYSISETGGRGVIQLEDPTASGLYNIEMECRMLVPIPQQTIYSKIIGINEKIVMAETGQLKIVIYEQSINKNNIRYVKNAYYPVDADGRPNGEAIQVGTPVVIKLLACKIIPRKSEIMSIGILESVVPPEEYDKLAAKKEETNLTSDEIEAVRGRKIQTVESSDIGSASESEPESETEPEPEIESTESGEESGSEFVEE